jgi:CheY-like chemotaxis protein
LLETASKYPLRILVAEDNSINQRLISKMLSRLGFKPDQFRLTADGQSAADEIQRQNQRHEEKEREAKKNDPSVGYLHNLGASLRFLLVHFPSHLFSGSNMRPHLTELPIHIPAPAPSLAAQLPYLSAPTSPASSHGLAAPALAVIDSPGITSSRTATAGAGAGAGGQPTDAAEVVHQQLIAAAATAPLAGTVIACQSASNESATFSSLLAPLLPVPPTNSVAYDMVTETNRRGTIV